MLAGGWGFGWVSLLSALPHAVTMKANTALGLACTAGALLLHGPGVSALRHRAAQYMCALAMSVAGMTLLEYLTGLDLAIDQLLVTDRGTPAGMFPGRPSTTASTCILLLGAAFFLKERRRTVQASQFVTLFVTLYAGASLLGYFYGIRNFAGLPFFTGIAVHTSASIVLLCFSLLFSMPDQGIMRIVSSPALGGHMARRLLPAAVLIPLALGWLQWQGEVSGHYSVAFGLALLTTASIAIMVFVIWLQGGHLNRTDVARVQALQELHESETRLAAAQAEARFRLAFEEAPVGIALIGGDGAWLHANRSLCEMTGYSEQEIIALNHGITYPDDMPETQALVDQMKSGAVTSCRLEKRYRHKNGTVVNVLVSVSALPRDAFGVVQGFVAHMVDITRLKQAEQAFRESEARFRGLLESAPDAMVIVDPAGRIVLVNSQTERLFGYERQELLGAGLERLIPERFRAGHTGLWDSYLQSPVARSVGSLLELRGRCKDGREIPVEISLSPIQVGSETWVSSSIRDTTERKRLEAERDLSRQQAVLSARLSAIGQMAAGIAHEVNNPLTVISASARNLVRLSERGEISSPAMLQHVERITQTAHRIARIVKSLRHVAHDDSREDLREVQVVEIVEECLELCSERFRVHSIRLEAPPVDPRLTIRCREGEIGQVILNLLQNAFDAVAGASAGQWVKLEVSVAGRCVVLAVTDSGPGVPPEVRPRIMEPFFTTKSIGKGTGLGLSLSRGIAEAHGGRLEFRDGPGPTCFQLILPLASKGMADDV